MTDRPMAFDDQGLESALRGLSGDIAWPTAAPVADGGATGPDIATRVRVRLSSEDRRRSRWWWVAGRPVRRSLVLAIIALLALAVAAAAVGLGLPGLRITFGEPPASVLPSPPASGGAGAGRGPTPSPTSSPSLPPIAGMNLRLGRQAELEEIEALTGISSRLPTDGRLGPPDSVWVDRARGDQVAFVWASSEELPESVEPGVGLIVMRFDGQTDEEFYEKVLNTGTTLVRVKVDGHDGYWLSGDPHFFFYRRGEAYIDDGRRWVGDALIWYDGTATYRIESALGREATIAIAESLD